MKMRPDDSGCLGVALRILTRRDHSCAELTQKLIKRGFASGQIRVAVDKCAISGYLDDNRFSAGYAHELQRKGYGRRRIEQKLVAKGIAREVVDRCLDACCQEEHQLRSCRQAMMKKLKSTPETANFSDTKSKLYRFLLYRGFSADVITQVVAEKFSFPG